MYTVYFKFSFVWRNLKFERKKKRITTPREIGIRFVAFRRKKIRIFGSVPILDHLVNQHTRLSGLTVFFSLETTTTTKTGLSVEC